MSIKVLGHHVHPMLVGFPLGLLGGSAIFDLIYVATKTGRWADVSFSMIGVGVISGLIAAPFGSLDWWGIPGGTRAKRIGLYHGMAAVASVLLFAVSWWLRYQSPTTPSLTSIALSLLGVCVLALAGWLGGELVQRLSIGVDEGAHPDAPSSLSALSPSEEAPSNKTIPLRNVSSSSSPPTQKTEQI